MKRFTIRTFAIFGALLAATAFVLWLEGARAYHIEQSTASADTPSLVELQKKVAQSRSQPKVSRIFR
jgi:hypothetical protein